MLSIRGTALKIRKVCVFTCLLQKVYENNRFLFWLDFAYKLTLKCKLFSCISTEGWTKFEYRILSQLDKGNISKYILRFGEGN